MDLIIRLSVPTNDKFHLTKNHRGLARFDYFYPLSTSFSRQRTSSFVFITLWNERLSRVHATVNNGWRFSTFSLLSLARARTRKLANLVCATQTTLPSIWFLYSRTVEITDQHIFKFSRACVGKEDKSENIQKNTVLRKSDDTRCSSNEEKCNLQRRWNRDFVQSRAR